MKATASGPNRELIRQTGGLARQSAGFTLLETMIAVAIFGLVIAGSLGVYIMCQKMWHATALDMDTSRMASLAIQRIVYGVGTNSGLRSAATMTFTNAYGHPYPNYTNTYWETGAEPPSATDAAHYTHNGCYYGTDGSWRLTFSNAYGGVKCIDYNIKARNILFWPDINSKSTRILVCNYVSSATATVDATNGTIAIQLTVWKKDGVFVSSNPVSAFIKMRN